MASSPEACASYTIHHVHTGGGGDVLQYPTPARGIIYHLYVHKSGLKPDSFHLSIILSTAELFVSFFPSFEDGIAYAISSLK